MYDEEGVQVWERSLDRYGKVLKGDNKMCPFTFQGQMYDADIELAYNRFRWYSDEDGRYISKDPIGLHSGEPNFYVYVEDSNIGVDIFGLQNSYRKKNGRFAKKPGRKSTKKRKNRKSEYPSGYRAGVVESVIKKNTRNGIIYDVDGNPVARKDVTMEHITPVVTHWNNGGNNMSRAERADFYNDTSNLGVLSKSENSRCGGELTETYTQEVGQNYSN